MSKMLLFFRIFLGFGSFFFIFYGPIAFFYSDNLSKTILSMFVTVIFGSGLLTVRLVLDPEADNKVKNPGKIRKFIKIWVSGSSTDSWRQNLHKNMPKKN